MRSSLKSSLIGLAGLAAAAAAAPAWAGCGDVSPIHPADWRPGPSEHLLQPVNLGAQSIVGLWSVQFMAGGAQVDFGYAAWHDDGTEIMNSGGRSPASENFCLGVWRQTGAFQYHLNHYALSYDPATGVLNAKVTVKEDVTLGPGAQTFSGPFTLDVLDPKTGALLQHVAGQVNGRRLN